MKTSQLTKKQLAWIFGSFAVFILLIGSASAVLYGVYVKRSDSSLIRTLGASLPAARVGSYRISYGDFLRSRDTLRVYLASDAAKEAKLAGPMTPSVEKNALDRLVRDAAVVDMAQQKKVVVSDDEVNTEFGKLMLSASTTQSDVDQYLRQTFNWNQEQFRQYVMRPALTEQHLAQTLTTSTDQQQAAVETAIDARLAQPDVKYYLRIDAPPALPETAP